MLFSCSSEDSTNIQAPKVNEKYTQGIHYEVIDKPTTVRDSSKIEVIEVFWFGCNHCYALEPYLARWKKDMPQGVNFLKSPATWNEVLKTHARIYYTAKALGIDWKNGISPFRKFSFSFLKDQQALTDKQIMRRFGWSNMDTPNKWYYRDLDTNKDQRLAAIDKMLLN